MANSSVAITAGAGTPIDAEQLPSGDYRQVIVVGDAATEAAVATVSAASGLMVSPSQRTVRLAATPTISTTAYTANDQVGTVMTFTGAASAIGRSGAVLGGVLTSRAGVTIIPNLDMFMFEVSPTMVGSDNAAFDITDANLETARYCGTIEFRSGDYDTLTNNTVCAGVNKPNALNFVTATTANLFGVMATRTAFTAASTTDFVVTLRIAQD